jgi:serine/threonine-protein kinase
MLRPGLLIGGRYRLEGIVGRGASATVWRAIHEGLGRSVAIKIIHREERTSPEVVARFVKEAHATAAVRHRFVVDIFDVGTTEEGQPYMVMELLQGESLAQRISSEPSMPLETFVDTMIKALDGLHAAHEAGIVHRDLKPENIFLVADVGVDGFFPKIVDFGISQFSEVSSLRERAGRLTRVGTIIGTPYYMSPEQVRGVSDLDRRTDIYSVGVIMYEVLSGLLPFTAETVGDLLVTIATSDAVPLAVVRPSLGEQLSEVVARAMARDLEARFTTALDMKEALQTVALPAGGVFTVVVEQDEAETTDALSTSANMPANSSQVLVEPEAPQAIDGAGERPNARPSEAEAVAPRPTATRPRRRSPVILLALAALTVLVGVVVSGLFALSSRSTDAHSVSVGQGVGAKNVTPDAAVGEVLPAVYSIASIDAGHVSKVDRPPVGDGGWGFSRDAGRLEDAPATEAIAKIVARPATPSAPSSVKQPGSSKTGYWRGRGLRHAFKNPGF